jgi:hypothetical protein
MTYPGTLSVCASLDADDCDVVPTRAAPSSPLSAPSPACAMTAACPSEDEEDEEDEESWIPTVRGTGTPLALMVDVGEEEGEEEGEGVEVGD